MSDSGRLPRFFSALPLSAGTMVLADSEAHHLMHVMRLGPGSSVVLFDGSGCECRATVHSTSRHQATLDAEEPQPVNRERSHALTVAVSLPRADRQKFLVEKLTELGVSRLVPLVTRRGVAQPSGGAIGRLKNGVIAASKQCGRNRLMEVGEPVSIQALLESTPLTSNRLFAHPGPSGIHPAAAMEYPETVIAIGPEGGFEEAEVAMFAGQGWVETSLGQTLLRVETAAIAAASLVCIGRPD